MAAALQQMLLAAGAASAGGIPFSAVKLLLGFEGANASTGSPGMTDESGAAHGTATVLGAAQISTAQFKFGSSSLLLNGSTDSITFADNADFHLGAGNFTVEGFIRPATIAAGTRFIVGQWGAATFSWILYQSGAALAWNVSTTGANNLADMTGGTLVANSQAAVCVDYDGAKYRLYLNGTMVASSVTARSIFAGASQPLSIGSNGANSSFWFNGFIDELRLTNGFARYASDAGYTVPTAAFPRS